MSGDPWLTIIGLGEDGPEGLSSASRKVLAAAEVVMGPPRHLELIGDVAADKVPWPVPFSEGIARLQALRGRKVAVLASGDPFWFGAGSVIARHFDPSEWCALPGVSCFALMAAHLGVPLEQVAVVALHAAPMARLRPVLGRSEVTLVTLRDGAAVAELARYLDGIGAGAAELVVFEHLGGPEEKLTIFQASEVAGEFSHPVCAAIRDVPSEVALPLTAGRIEDTFEHDGQITKSPIRAMTLAALAPREDELLWDLGAGSGSVAMEWLLAGARTRAICVEKDAERAARVARNGERFGFGARLEVIHGAALDMLPEAVPDAVFVGGGADDVLLRRLFEVLPSGVRLVVNAVTLESETLLTLWQGKKGGDLLRIDLSRAVPLGPRMGWKAAYPVVQWSVVT